MLLALVLCTLWSSTVNTQGKSVLLSVPWQVVIWAIVKKVPLRMVQTEPLQDKQLVQRKHSQSGTFSLSGVRMLAGKNWLGLRAKIEAVAASFLNFQVTNKDEARKAPMTLSGRGKISVQNEVRQQRSFDIHFAPKTPKWGSVAKMRLAQQISHLDPNGAIGVHSNFIASNDDWP